MRIVKGHLTKAKSLKASPLKAFISTALLVIVCLSGTALAQSQAPGIEWQKAYGGGTSNYYTAALQQTSDGGYIIVGKELTGFDKIIVVKTDVAGTELWRKTYGSPYADDGWQIEQTADGGYIISGDVSLNGDDVTGLHGKYDLWLLKIDSLGAKQWQKTYGGSETDGFAFVTQTPDGGYIMSGVTYSNDGDLAGMLHGGSGAPGDAMVIKLSSAGAIQWAKTYGGPGYDAFLSITPAPGGGYYACGLSGVVGGDVTAAQALTDAWLVKLDNNGGIVWQKSLGGSFREQFFYVRSTTDGGCVAAGFTASSDGDITGNHNTNHSPDGWVVKADANGTIQWSKVLGSTTDDAFQSVRQTANGGYILGGYNNKADGDVSANWGQADAWVVRLKSDGSLDWEKSLGGSNRDGSDGMMTNDVIQTADGGYAIASTTLSPEIPGIVNAGVKMNMYLVKLLPPCDTIATVHDTALCVAQVINLPLAARNNAGPYTWSTGATSALIAVSDTGTYWRIAGAACRLRTDTFHIRNAIASSNYLHDTLVCKNASVLLTADTGYNNYVWNTGQQSPQIAVATSGIFWRKATDACRMTTDTFAVRYKAALPDAELGPDRQACINGNLRIGHSYLGVQYLWSTGDTTGYIQPAESDTYTLTITNGCETAQDSVYVRLEHCDDCVFLPTAFSPNGDGRNDDFGALTKCAVTHLRLEVYDRWGQKVFVSYKPEQKWDGTFGGIPLPLGTYYYQLAWEQLDGKTATAKGDITLIR